MTTEFEMTPEEGQAIADRHMAEHEASIEEFKHLMVSIFVQCIAKINLEEYTPETLRATIETRIKHLMEVLHE